jgi:hypothetical protein
MRREGEMIAITVSVDPVKTRIIIGCAAGAAGLITQLRAAGYTVNGYAVIVADERDCAEKDRAVHILSDLINRSINKGE